MAVRAASSSLLGTRRREEKREKRRGVWWNSLRRETAVGIVVICIGLLHGGNIRLKMYR